MENNHQIFEMITVTQDLFRSKQICGVFKKKTTLPLNTRQVVHFRFCNHNLCVANLTRLSF